MLITEFIDTEIIPQTHIRVEKLYCEQLQMLTAQGLETNL
jgi:hypothetical protein